MRDGKNIKKVAVSSEKVLISGYGNARLRPYFTLAHRAYRFGIGPVR
jgi:hypothetical protein